MKNNISSFVVGLLFALGLGISGMTQPLKVVGFLDFFGRWDPSLVFVMLGAIVVHFILYRLIRRRKSPMYSEEWHVPRKNEITPALVFGALIFGAGWGLAGFCPGPAITSLASFQIQPILFVVSMIAGMSLFRAADHQLKFKK